MKRILIIEDDQVAGNVSYNHLMAEGFHVRATLDGESGLQAMRDFKPDLILLDLILPKMSGLEVIKQVRSEPEFARIPIIVFSNAYLTSLVQDAWKAGATKCISKANCSTRELIDAVRRALYDSIRDRNAVAPFVPATQPQKSAPLITPSPAAPVVPAAAPGNLSAQNDSAFESDLRQTCLAGLPATLASLRSTLQALVKVDGETARLKEIFVLYRRVHALAGNTAVVGLMQIAQMAAALEALLKELHEKPASINPSTLRTIASAVDFLGYLFQHGTHPGAQQVSTSKILVVDDEPISRRAVVYALEKAQLESISVDSAEAAYALLVERPFDLVFLDVDMPGMTGLELCAKLRALPAHKKTPVVFVTALSDFDSRTSSTMAGGTDFIAKPFLFIELTVKALIHVLRGRVPPVK